MQTVGNEITWTVKDNEDYSALLSDVLANYENAPALLAGLKLFTDENIWNVEKMKELVATLGIPKSSNAFAEGFALEQAFAEMTLGCSLVKNL